MPCQTLQFLDRKISEGICSDHMADFGNRMAAGNQVFLRVNIGPIIAREEKGRRCDAHMDLFGAGLPKKPDDPFAGCSANNGVINQDYTLAFYGFTNRRKFDSDLISPRIRCDECAADIFVLDQADSVWNPRSLRVTDGSVKSGVRNTDYNISTYRMCLRQCCARALSRRMN